MYCRGISKGIGIEEELLTYLYMILNTDYVFKAKKHKVQFAEMLAELSLEKLELKGKSKMYIENEILFFYAHFYFLDKLRDLPADHPALIRNDLVVEPETVKMAEPNTNFKQIDGDDWFDLEEDNSYVLITNAPDGGGIFAGIFEEREDYDEHKDDPLWLPTIDLQACHKLSEDGKKWIRVGGKYGMSYCEFHPDYIDNIYAPKRDVDVSTTMELWLF